MSCCSHCRDAENFFSNNKARKELKRYRKKGPEKSTTMLIDAIRSADLDLEQAALFDVGSGIGEIQLELFKEGLRCATNVDASRPYIETAREEIARQGWGDRSGFHFGDVVEIAPSLDAADIVTLNRVICCYPYPDKLIPATTDKAKAWYGVVYPRKRWITRIGKWVANKWFSLKGDEFRIYLHDPDSIENLIAKQGFSRHYAGTTFLWHIHLYRRDNEDN